MSVDAIEMAGASTKAAVERFAVEIGATEKEVAVALLALNSVMPVVLPMVDGAASLHGLRMTPESGKRVLTLLGAMLKTAGEFAVLPSAGGPS